MIQILVLLAAFLFGASPLQLRELVIPSSLVIGTTTTISCALELDGDVLESVKWYKDGRELCIYRSINASQHFRAERDIKMKDIKCENSTLRLRPISAQASGTYKCEATALRISSTKTSVQTVMGSRNLSVFAYPMNSPVINGLKTYYHTDEFVEASCTSPPSYPAPEMSWTLNGKTVDNFKTHTSIAEVGGMLEATINLKLLTSPAFFKNPGGYALLACTSVLMDTPPMTAEAKMYFSVRPALSASEGSNSEIVEIIAKSRKSAGGRKTPRPNLIYLALFITVTQYKAVAYANWFETGKLLFLVKYACVMN